MSFKKICAFIILVPLAMILVAFIIANRSLVALNLDIFAAFFGKTQEGYSITAPLFIWLFAFLLLGIAIGSLAMLPKLCRAHKKQRGLESENNRLHKNSLAGKPQAAKDYLDDITP